jgi:hypothetical protein
MPSLFLSRLRYSSRAPVSLLRLLMGLFPLTLQGTITLLITAMALRVYGYGAMDLVVFALAICALTIVIASLFCAIICGILIQRRVHRLLLTSRGYAKGIQVEAGFPNETGFSLPVLTWFPLVKLTWRVVYPDYIDTRVRVSGDNVLYEEIIPRRRCLTDHLVRQFTVSDVLGFCRYTWRQQQELDCMALPQTNTIKPLPLLRSMTAEDGIPNPTGNPDGDRMEIRPYVPGDSVRNIMWKVYARNRQLNVRLAERSVFHSKRTVAYLLSSRNDEAAAAIARVALESGALGEDWVFAADGTETPSDKLAPALVAIARSRALHRPYSYGLDQFLLQALGGSSAHCIVFAAAEMAPWLPHLKLTMARYPGQFSLVLATDGFDEGQRESLWKRLLLRPLQPVAGRSTSSSRGDLRNLLTEMGQLVESTLIVDRASGYSFDQFFRKV